MNQSDRDEVTILCFMLQDFSLRCRCMKGFVHVSKGFKVLCVKEEWESRSRNGRILKQRAQLCANS